MSARVFATFLQTLPAESLSRQATIQVISVSTLDCLAQRHGGNHVRPLGRARLAHPLSCRQEGLLRRQGCAPDHSCDCRVTPSHPCVCGLGACSDPQRRTQYNRVIALQSALHRRGWRAALPSRQWSPGELRIHRQRFVDTTSVSIHRALHWIYPRKRCDDRRRRYRLVPALKRGFDVCAARSASRSRFQRASAPAWWRCCRTPCTPRPRSPRR